MNNLHAIQSETNCIWNVLYLYFSTTVHPLSKNNSSAISAKVLWVFAAVSQTYCIVIFFTSGAMLRSDKWMKRWGSKEELIWIFLNSLFSISVVKVLFSVLVQCTHHTISSRYIHHLDCCSPVKEKWKVKICSVWVSSVGINPPKQICSTTSIDSDLILFTSMTLWLIALWTDSLCSV